MSRFFSMKSFVILFLATTVCWVLSYSFSALAEKESFPKSALMDAGKKIQGSTEHRQIEITREFSLNPSDVVLVKTKSVGVKVVPTSAELLTMHLKGSTTSEVPLEELLTLERKGGKVSGQVNQGGISESSVKIQSFGIQINDLELVVSVPESFKNRLEVVTSSGDIDLQRIQLSEMKVQATSGEIGMRELEIESLSAEASSGDIEIASSDIGELKSVTRSGDYESKNSGFQKVKIHTSSGDIRLRMDKIEVLSMSSTSGSIEVEKSDIGEVETSSSSGQIRLEGVKGKVTAISSSGDVDIVVENLSPVVEARTSSGDLTVRLASASDFQLKMQTSSGDFGGNLDIEAGDQKRIEKAFGSKKNPGQVSLKTSSGDLIIYR